MPPVPLLRTREVVRAFEKLGLRVAQRGSHVIMVKPGHEASLSIPDHPQIARGTLRSLIRKAGISVEDFEKSLTN